ncbi:oligosaccharide flippase family protein [Nocardioides cavernae]|uniref:Oligosaccharide flippase family protein n=1 Tax=Nocardioides cavernae TaxID=1921566 RepID=A0ABR8N5L9_9ACTN|nr:oligosaccharide flippase family protein [Nocardioides cavernae]MBM7511622.1 O-antigen/teichoic acid export membrane protein [Nocardioides cavernae]
MAAPPIATLVAYSVLAQLLGPEGRGFAAAATAPLLLITSALTLGLPEALTYFESQTAVRRRVSAGAIAALLFAGMVGTALTYWASDSLSGGDADLAQTMTWVAAFSAPALLVAGLRGIALARQRWSLVATERILSALLRLTSILVLALVLGLTPTNAALALGATLAVGGVVYVRLLRREPRRQELAREAQGPTYRQLHGYGLRAWLGSIAGILLMRLDQLLLTPLAGLQQLGFYVVAVNVAEAALIFNAAVREVVFSKQSSRGDVRQLARASRMSTVVTLALVIALASLAPVAIPIVFGDAFSPSIGPTMILLAAVLLGNPGSVVGAGLAASGRPELRSFSLLAGLVVNVVIIVTLAPQWGAAGAALATLAGNVVSAGLNIRWYCRIAEARPRDFLVLRASDFRDTVAVARTTLRRHR